MELFQRVGPIKHCKVLYPVSDTTQAEYGAVGPTGGILHCAAWRSIRTECII